MINIERQYPLLAELERWMRVDPQCSASELLTQAFTIATTSQWQQGVLKIGDDAGAQSLINQKYFSAN